MEKQKSWHGDLFDVATDLQRIARCICSLSDAAFRMGNDRLSEELAVYFEDLLRNEEAVRKAVGTKTSEDLRQAQDMTATVFSAVLGKCLREDKQSKSKPMKNKPTRAEK